MHFRQVKRREFITLLGGAAAAWPFAARAQQDRLPRIALFMGIADDAEGRRRAAAFRQGLQQLGWKEGTNVRLDERWGVADTDVIRASAMELLQLNPSVIVVQGARAVPILQQTTKTIPIVFVSGPGEFDTPHQLAMDSTGRLFVADRVNNRIQIFDQDGKFLEEWKQFGRPSGLYIDRNDNLYSADHQSGDKDGKVNPGFKKGIRVSSAKDGKVAAFIPEIAPDANMPEGIAADSSGIIYGGWTGKMNLRRWVKAATQ